MATVPETVPTSVDVPPEGDADTWKALRDGKEPPKPEPEEAAADEAAANDAKADEPDHTESASLLARAYQCAGRPEEAVAIRLRFAELAKQVQ